MGIWIKIKDGIYLFHRIFVTGNSVFGKTFDDDSILIKKLSNEHEARIFYNEIWTTITELLLKGKQPFYDISDTKKE